jgi:hypothetical protein
MDRADLKLILRAEYDLFLRRLGDLKKVQGDIAKAYRDGRRDARLRIIKHEIHRHA